MKPRDTGIARLDLRLVPAALTSWAATAAGILWQTGGSVLVVVMNLVADVFYAWADPRIRY